MPPTRTATITLRAVAARPTVSEIRAPTIRRLRRSLPNWSVPSRYSADGPCILSSMFTSSYGKRARESAKIATKIKINTIIPLIVPSGFSLTSLTKKSASRERFFGSIAEDCMSVASFISRPLRGFLLLDTTGVNHPHPMSVASFMYSSGYRPRIGVRGKLPYRGTGHACAGMTGG